MASLRSSDPAYVLYVDHQGHPAPLSESFHATASRRLSSTVDRLHRPSTVTQVDSAYCPQCLSFHDASSATQLGYCPKPTCLRCPLCTSIVVCIKLLVENKFCFSCGRCDWNSIQCHLTVDAEDPSSALSQLSSLLQEKRQDSGHFKTAEEHYQIMIKAWESFVKTNGPKASSSSSKPGQRRTGTVADSWSIQGLESTLQSKNDWLSASTSTVPGGQPLQRISLQGEQSLEEHLKDISVASIALQALTAFPTKTMADLLPLSVPLRARKSRRCRAELAEGKPGILLKPKLNPLEGDSSLRTGHGQWWKKDSSAVHVVPRTRVILHGRKPADKDNHTQLHAFVLKVTNSTLGLVRLRIGLSLYEGESFWDYHDHHPTSKNTSLECLLVETISNKHVDASLLTPTVTSQTTFKSNMVVLDSNEGSIVDIGKAFEVPDEISNWNADEVLESVSIPTDGVAENKVEFASVKVLAEKSGSAWFEVICAAKQKTDETMDGFFSAIPISLQIEVGKGSWESSLIKAISADDYNTDLVTFDLVVTWPSNNTSTTKH